MGARKFLLFILLVAAFAPAHVQAVPLWLSRRYKACRWALEQRLGAKFHGHDLLMVESKFAKTPEDLLDKAQHANLTAEVGIMIYLRGTVQSGSHPLINKVLAHITRYGGQIGIVAKRSLSPDIVIASTGFGFFHINGDNIPLISLSENASMFDVVHEYQHFLQWESAFLRRLGSRSLASLTDEEWREMSMAAYKDGLGRPTVFFRLETEACQAAVAYARTNIGTEKFSTTAEDVEAQIDYAELYPHQSLWLKAYVMNYWDLGDPAIQKDLDILWDLLAEKMRHELRSRREDVDGFYSPRWDRKQERAWRYAITRLSPKEIRLSLGVEAVFQKSAPFRARFDTLFKALSAELNMDRDGETQ